MAEGLNVFFEVDNAVIAAHLDNPAVVQLLGALQARGIEFAGAEGGWLVALYGSPNTGGQPVHRSVLRRNLLDALREKAENDSRREHEDRSWKAHSDGHVARAHLNALCEGMYGEPARATVAAALATEWGRKWWGLDE